MAVKSSFGDPLQTIATNIIGPRPGLWVPLPPTRLARRKTGAEFAVVKAYSEIPGKSRSAAEFWDALVRKDLQPVVIALSAINILLEREMRTPGIEEVLVSKYLDPALKVASITDMPLPDYHIVFNRLGILASLKALLAIRKQTTKTEPYHNYQIGLIILRANDFLTSKAIRDEDERQLDLDLLAEFFPTWELMNPRNLAYGLSRMFVMITAHLVGNSSTIANLRKQIGIKPETLLFDGLTLEDYVAIVFGIYSHVRQTNIPQLVTGTAPCTIDANDFLTSTRFPREKLQRFLRKRSLRMNRLRRLINGGKPWSKKIAVSKIEADDFATDFLVLRQYPIIDLDNGKYLIIDIQFVGELLFSGLFFQLFFSLPSSTKRDNFLSLWGEIFELYLRGLLEYYYPERAGILRTNIKFEGGQIDALLDFGTYIIVFEFKFFLLEHKAKHIRNKASILKMLTLKLVENQRSDPKAVRQLIKAAHAVKLGKVETALKEPKPIYPVIVAYDPAVESLAVNTFLNSEFKRLCPENDEYLRPLTIMSVQDLEILLPQTGAGHVTWKEVLEKRFERDRVTIPSVHQALYDTMKAKGRDFEANSYLLRIFDQIHDAIKIRYGYKA